MRPPTVTGLALPEPDAEVPLAVQVAVYEVIGEVPVELGAMKPIEALELPAVAVPMVGAPGVLAVGVFDPLDDPPPPHPARVRDISRTDKLADVMGINRLKAVICKLFTPHQNRTRQDKTGQQNSR